jgi:NAD(P)-dependent dehydrogenase (short-subunit alcohol dehydrogenase family)
MQGKTVVITGATSGIGQVAAEQLARRGARIVLIARDSSRAAATLERLRSSSPGIDHTFHLADLSLVSETKRLAATIKEQERRIDVLINNAGALFGRREVTKEGLERTFATNHMSYFALTWGLLDRLAASKPARVINTASAAHTSAVLDFDDLQGERYFTAFAAYSQSKLCNILFTKELARRTKAVGVTANCLHPGFVATRFGDQSGGFASLGVRFAKWFAISPQRGAQTIIYLASAAEVGGFSGDYFYKCRPKTPSDAALDDASAALLWSKSLELYQRS